MSGKKARARRRAEEKGDLRHRDEYSPQDVPALRDLVAENVRVNYDATQRAMRCIEKVSAAIVAKGGREPSEILREVDARARDAQMILDAIELGRGELWFVEQDLLSLAVVAAKDEPEPELPPYGYLFFQRPMASEHLETLLPEDSGICAKGRDPMVGITWNAPARTAQFVTWFPDGLGMVGDGRKTGTVHDDVMCVTAWRLVNAIVALAAYPGVTSSAKHEVVPRATSAGRSAERLKGREEVRVVRVRERLDGSEPPRGDDGRSRREYSHRFIVRGFYRNQVCGPERSERRRIWVPPFVKGPADKPLIVRDVVNYAGIPEPEKRR